MIVTGELYKCISVDYRYMSVATLNALSVLCQMYFIIYKIVKRVCGSHNSSGYRDRRSKFLQ